jgi:hypothetical protein
LSKNPGGTPLRVPFPKPERTESPLLLDFQLSTLNFKLSFPLTPIIPPLMHCPSVSPFLATLTKKTGEWGGIFR